MCNFCCKFAADFSMREYALAFGNQSNGANWTNWTNWTPGGRREDAELQDGRRPEGKESGFRSLESNGRKTEEAEDMDAELQDGWKPTGRAEPYRIASISSPTR